MVRLVEGEDFTEQPPDATGLAETFATIARALLGEPSVEGTLQRIVDTAVETVPGCDHAGISLVERRRISTTAASDAVPGEVDAIQYETDSGPCLDAIREHEAFLVDDLLEESRWPDFARRAAESTGVRSVLSLRLFAEQDTMGGLNLYAREPAAFDLHAQAIGAVFAAHAAVALSSSRREANLERALETRDLIGQAKGILIAHQHMTANEAFDALRRASQHLHLKLHDVADRVVFTGEIPTQIDEH